MNFKYFGLIVLLSGAPLFAAQAERKRSAAEQEKLDKALFEEAAWAVVGTIKKLLDEGANPNWEQPDTGRTALLNLAGNNGYYPAFDIKRGIESVQLLVKNGANINHQDKRGNTPLLVTSNREPSMIKCLLDLGADPAVRNHEGLTVFHRAAYAGLPEIKGAKIMDLLIQKLKERDKSVINAQDKHGETPLMLAGKYCPQCIAALIKAHADPFITDYYGKTALDYASNPYAKKILSEYMNKLNTITQTLGEAANVPKPVSGIVIEYLGNPMEQSVSKQEGENKIKKAAPKKGVVHTRRRKKPAYVEGPSAEGERKKEKSAPKKETVSRRRWRKPVKS